MGLTPEDAVRCQRGPPPSCNGRKIHPQRSAITQLPVRGRPHWCSVRPVRAAWQLASRGASEPRDQRSTQAAFDGLASQVTHHPSTVSYRPRKPALTGSQVQVLSGPGRGSLAVGWRLGSRFPRPAQGPATFLPCRLSSVDPGFPSIPPSSAASSASPSNS